MSDLFRCPRCRREVDISWRTGEPLVRVYAARLFQSTDVDGTRRLSPAGFADGELMCLQCDITVWAALRETLQRRCEAVGGD